MMSDIANNLLAEILRLPEADRASIVQEVLLTLSPSTENYEDEELGQELDARLDDFAKNPEGSIPWSELRNEP
jgi:putative addiction module component (TIGR02574 family)